MPSEVTAVLLDLAGVLYVENEPIAGAAAAVERLREVGLALRFVTNTTAHAREQTLAKLARLGFDIEETELMTPAALAVRYCRRAGHRRAVLVMNDEVKRDFAELEESADGAQAVIVGDLGSAFAYDVLNRAFRQLMEGAELIALQKNLFVQVLDDLGVAARTAVMVGDDIESDIGGALRAGLRAVLVRTGKFREERVRASGIQPTAVIDSVAELPGLLVR